VCVCGDRYTGDPGLLITQTYGVLALTALGALPMLLLCVGLSSFDMFRTSVEEEEIGLDLYVFGLSAYVTNPHPNETVTLSLRP
jgi:ammonia channel protein AmtB